MRRNVQFEIGCQLEGDDDNNKQAVDSKLVRW